MHFEELIEKLQNFGLYQKILITVISCTKAAFVPSMIMMAFAGKEPDWWCDTSDGRQISEGISNHSYKNESYKNCNWNGTCRRVFSDDMVTVVSEWELVCDQKWISNIIISIQMAGILVGAILCGYCAGAYGRKRLLIIAVLINCIGNAISIFSVSWIMFVVLRVFIGIGAGMYLGSNYIYQVEFIGPKWRTFVSTIPSWPIGAIILSGLAKWLHNWKWLHLATAVFSLPFLCCYFFIPESIRWLVVKGRLDEANRVIQKMAKVNKKPVPDTSILTEIADEEKATTAKAGNYSYKALFRTRHLAKTTILTCFCWFTCSVIYYGIMFGLKDMSGDFYLNMLLMAVTELPVPPVFILLAAILSRKAASFLTYLLSAAFSFGLVLATRFASEDGKEAYVNACAMTTKFCITLAWSFTNVQSIEQFPTVIRSLGVGAMYTASRLGGVVASQLLSLGGDNDLTPTFIIMGVLATVSALSTLFLRETRDKALEDTLKTFIVNMDYKNETSVEILVSVDGTTNNRQDAADKMSVFKEKSNDEEYLMSDKSGTQEYLMSDKSDTQEYLMSDKSDTQEYLMSDKFHAEEYLISDKSDTQENLMSDKSDAQEYLMSDKSNAKEYLMSDKSDVQKYLMSDKSDAQEYLMSDKSDAQEHLMIDKSDVQKYLMSNKSDAQEYLVKDK